jgi:NADH dehydrogenase
MAKQVIVAEMVDKLVSSLPEWMSLYVLKNLTEMGIQVRLSSKIVDLNENDVVLSTGEQIKNALCIWTTGLEASTLARELDIEKAKNGRINVDPMLRFKENCFAAGDAACFKKNNKILRMSVQHALNQGRIAAENTIALISGCPLKKYVPYDPGYIIPLSEGRSCGEVFGLPVKGKIATALHYLINMYRSTGVYNKLGIAKGSIKAF